MSNLNINSSLTYALPDITEDGSLQYVSYKPQGGSSFNQGESITVKVSSNTQMVNLKRSYVKFRLTTSAIGTLNPQGLSSVFNSVQDTISGLSLPVARNFHIQKQVSLITDESERKTITAVCEQYRDGITGQSTTAGGVFTVCLPIPTSFETDKLLPLPIMNAGWQAVYSLNNANVVVSAGTYTITDFELCCAMIQPSPDYLQEVSKGLQSGGALKIPVMLYRSITSNLSTSSSQNLILQTGYLSSINTITMVEKTLALGLARNGADVQSYFINLDGQRYPSNKSIAGREENIYMTLASYNTSISSISAPDVGQPFQQFSFKTNSDFGSGVPTSNGVVEIALELTGVAVGSTIETIVSYDALLLVSNNSCSLITDV